MRLCLFVFATCSDLERPAEHTQLLEAAKHEEYLLVIQNSARNAQNSCFDPSVHHLIYILRTLLLEILINILVAIQKAIRSHLYMALH